MKVLHLTSHLNVGGITSYILSLSDALAARGYRVIIASGGGQMEARASGGGLAHWRVPLRTKAEFSPQVWSAIRQLEQRLRREPVDVLHAHTRVGQVAADRLARRLNIPYVTTWHGFYRANLGRRLWPCTGTRAIAISEPVRQHLMRDFGVSSQRIRLIPHGIDPAPFEARVEPAEQQRLCAAVGLAPGVPVIGTVARLVPSREIDQLIASLPHIRASVPEAQLLIVGDGEDRGRLQAAASARRVADAVHFAGTLPEPRVALSLMQVFVFLPAEEEGFGFSLLEAMAAGRPIVAVRRGRGAAWVLEESKVGVLVEPGDTGGLAAAITRFLQDGEAACRAAGEARAVVQQRYTLARMADQVEDVYRAVSERVSE